jgi:predicted amidophosphoribosyltransferase
MPEGTHLRGVSRKEQRQYEHIKENAKKSGRYGKWAEDVATRTVTKQHSQKGHSRGR